MSGPKYLVLDIETAPHLGYHWGLWQQNIEAMKQLRVPGRMLCFGARFHGEKKIHFASEYHDGRLEMLNALHDLVDEADFLVGWNSARFDRPWFQGEMDKEGISLPSPTKDIDLMRVAKKNFRLPSYKLDYVAQRHYGLPGKVSHSGFQLWLDVMEGDEATKAKAWRDMKRYQIGDINVTDAVFTHMKPLVPNLPNPALYSEDGTPEACGCGNTQLQARGFQYTAISRFQRYQCYGEKGCGAWLRSGKRDKGIDLRRAP